MVSGKNQDYSMYNFVVKNRVLQPFVFRLTATNLYPYKTRQHNREIIWVIPVAAKVLDNSQQYNELRIGPCGHNGDLFLIH